MIRVKSFEATGIAPNGRLFAGDLNSIQDAAAGKSDFSQTIDTGAIRLGDTSLQLLKYGIGEMRFTSALRTDGIVRGLGGFVAGAFTTTQRDAIPAGFAPYGILILNTTTNQYEWNNGSDGARTWVGLITAVPQGEITGAVKMWLTGTAPAGYLLLDGTPRLRASFTALNSLLQAASYPFGSGDGVTTFDLPDMRGRVPVGLGTNGDHDSLGENEGAALADRRAKHKHTVGVTYQGEGATAGGVGGPGPNIPSASFNPSGALRIGVTVGPQTNSPTDGPAYMTINWIVKT